VPAHSSISSPRRWKDFAPIALTSLLKHPLCRLGLGPSELRRGLHALELAAFRAPYFGSGLDGVEAALEQAQARSWQHVAVRRLASADWDAARMLVRRLGQAFAPMARVRRRKPAALHVWRECFETAQTLAKRATATAPRCARARPANGRRSCSPADRCRHAAPT
jgi:inactivated superfamily I helicase